MALAAHPTLQERDNRIDGAVLALFDTETSGQTETRTQAELQHAQNLSQALIEALREPVVVLDANLHVQIVNHPFANLFSIPHEQTKTQPLAELAGGQFADPELRGLLEKITPTNSRLDAFPLEVKTARGNRRLTLRARRIAGHDSRAPLILLTMDVPKPKSATR
jgi:two-component system, chemotaxis family, CheB/CheR fusion protein